MYVKNAKGLSVQDPDRHDRLPADGKFRNVPDSDYWVRRIQAGDVMTHANPKPEDVEGYEPPAPVDAAAPPVDVAKRSPKADA